MSEKEFIIRKPDDWHLHLRDGEMLASVIQHSAANFERAIIMPNLVPPVVTTDDAIAYKERINQVIPHGMSFQPLMTLYLTEATKTSDIKQGVDRGGFSAQTLSRRCNHQLRERCQRIWERLFNPGIHG